MSEELKAFLSKIDAKVSGGLCSMTHDGAHAFLMDIQELATEFAASAASQPADVAAMPTAGDWIVRERRNGDGELADCFIQAPPEGDMAYGLEVLGDDYTGFGDVERKLEHCRLIVSLVNRASQAEPMSPAEPGALTQSIADLEAWLETECIDIAVSQVESVHLVLNELKRLRAAEATAASDVKRIWPEKLTPVLQHALGLMNFQTGPIAHLFRATGDTINTKCEDEQAFVLHWVAGLALEHGDGWRKAVGKELDARCAIRDAKAGETT